MAIMRNPEDVDRQFAVYEAQFAALRTENAELRERLAEIGRRFREHLNLEGVIFYGGGSITVNGSYHERLSRESLRFLNTPTLPTNVPEPGNECCKECKGTGKLNAVLHEGVEVIACPTCMGTGFKFGEGMTLTEAYAYHKAKRKNMVTVRREDLDAVMLAIKYDCLPSDAITNRLKAALAAAEKGEPKP